MLVYLKIQEKYFLTTLNSKKWELMAAEEFSVTAHDDLLFFDINSKLCFDTQCKSFKTSSLSKHYKGHVDVYIIVYGLTCKKFFLQFNPNLA